MNSDLPVIREVSPGDLRLPPSRSAGADPRKLQRQVAHFGSSFVAMPPIVVYEAADGVLVIYDGVTRATRAHLVKPEGTVQVEVIGRLRRNYAGLPRIGDRQ